MSPYSQAVRTAQAYYNSDDAENFYSRLWGGEDIHIGLYESDSEAVVDASHRTVEHMCDLLGPALDGATVLDIGGGYGGSARYIAQHHNADVVSLNLSEVQNERARRKNAERGLDQRVSIVDGDFENIPFDEGHFDIVWSQDAMLHSGNRTRVLDEAVRDLRARYEAGEDVAFAPRPDSRSLPDCKYAFSANLQSSLSSDCSKTCTATTASSQVMR